MVAHPLPDPLDDAFHTVAMDVLRPDRAEPEAGVVAMSCALYSGPRIPTCIEASSNSPSSEARRRSVPCV